MVGFVIKGERWQTAAGSAAPPELFRLERILQTGRPPRDARFCPPEDSQPAMGL